MDLVIKSRERLTGREASSGNATFSNYYYYYYYCYYITVSKVVATVVKANTEVPQYPDFIATC